MKILKNQVSKRDEMPLAVPKDTGYTPSVLLVGFEFYPHRISGDKNFWLNLSFELSPELDKLIILSVNSSPVKSQRVGNIFIYNVNRFLHMKKNDQKRRHQKHFFPREVLERSATLFKVIPLLKKLVKSHNIQIIHLMDNFGLSTSLLKLFFPKLSILATGITYNVHNLPSRVYSLYQKMIWGNIDEVVVSSGAYKQKLIEDGFSEKKIKVLRWGVPIPNGKETWIYKDKKARTTKVILWTGFAQQVKTKSFYLSLSLAQKLLKKKASVDFIFAFKPECFNKDYALFQGEHLKIITTDCQDYQRLLAGVDLLLAPLDSSRSTVAPPLTWLECMALGIPVISTRAPGVDEILKPNFTGFVANTDQELEVLIDKILRDEDLLSDVSRNAKEWVKQNYNLKHIAQDYLRLWREDGRVILSSQNRLSV